MYVRHNHHHSLHLLHSHPYQIAACTSHSTQSFHLLNSHPYKLLHAHHTVPSLAPPQFTSIQTAACTSHSTQSFHLLNSHPYKLLHAHHTVPSLAPSQFTSIQIAACTSHSTQPCTFSIHIHTNCCMHITRYPDLVPSQFTSIQIAACTSHSTQTLYLLNSHPYKLLHAHHTVPSPFTFSIHIHTNCCMHITQYPDLSPSQFTSIQIAACTSHSTQTFHLLNSHPYKLLHAHHTVPRPCTFSIHIHTNCCMHITQYPVLSPSQFTSIQIAAYTYTVPSPFTFSIHIHTNCCMHITQYPALHLLNSHPYKLLHAHHTVPSPFTFSIHIHTNCCMYITQYPALHLLNSHPYKLLHAHHTVPSPCTFSVACTRYKLTCLHSAHIHTKMLPVHYKTPITYTDVTPSQLPVPGTNYLYAF